MSSPIKVTPSFFTSNYSDFYPSTTNQQFYTYPSRQSFDETAPLDPCCWQSETPSTLHQTIPYNNTQHTPNNTNYSSVSPFAWPENNFSIGEYNHSIPYWSPYGSTPMIDPQTLFAYTKSGRDRLLIFYYVFV